MFPQQRRMELTNVRVNMTTVSSIPSTIIARKRKQERKNEQMRRLAYILVIVGCIFGLCVAAVAVIIPLKAFVTNKSSASTTLAFMATSPMTINVFNLSNSTTSTTATTETTTISFTTTMLASTTISILTTRTALTPSTAATSTSTTTTSTSSTTTTTTSTTTTTTSTSTTTPIAAVAVSSSSSYCGCSNFTLSLINITFSTSGATYQWQASPSSQNFWSNISLFSSSSSWTVSNQTSSTDYRCQILVVVPTNSLLRSTIVTATNTYCAPRVVSCSLDDLIDDFILMGELNTMIYDVRTGCASNAYDNRSQESVTLWAGTNYTALVSSRYSTGDHVSIWIDFNDNCIFEASEIIVSYVAVGTSDISVNIKIPPIGLGAVIGSHRMRATVAYGSLLDPCSSSNTYGETHDYTINVFANATNSPMAPCTPIVVGSSSNLYNSSTVVNVYSCNAYSWTSPMTGTATLAFQLQNDPSYWYVDDVAVYNRGQQIIINGGFESGSFSPGWTVSYPFGTCSGPGAVVSTYAPRSGSYSIKDGYIGCADQISQSFPVLTGQTYVVSFWIAATGSGPGITATVTLS